MKISVFPNTDSNRSLEATKSVVEELINLGVTVLMDEDIKGSFNSLSVTFTDYNSAVSSCDLVIAIGGDGTVIHHALNAGLAGKAILGINAGRLGFLSGLEISERELLKQLITGEYEKHSRMLLQAQVICGDRVVYDNYCLNDAVIKTSGTRMVDLSVTSSGKKIGSYRADGVIFSTPTGSTAYSLSAGGPVVDPGLECLIMTPICAHSLINRSIIFGTDNQLQVSLDSKDRGDLLLTLDGQDPVVAGENSFVNIKKADICVEFITLKRENFYEVLNQKMIDRTV